MQKTRTQHPSGSPGLLARDDGFALLVVVGVISVLTVMVVSAYALSAQTLFDVQRATSTQQAFQVANAGFDRGMRVLFAAGGGSVVWPLTGTTASGSYVTSYAVVTGDTYTLTAVGTYYPPAGTGLRSIVQTVTQQFTYHAGSSMGLWDKFVFLSPTNMNPSGWSTSTFWGSLYTAGDLRAKNLNATPGIKTDAIYDYGGQVQLGNQGVTTPPLHLYHNINQAISPVSQGFDASSGPSVTMQAIDWPLIDTVPAPGSVVVTGTYPMTLGATSIDCTSGANYFHWVGGSTKSITASGCVYFPGAVQFSGGTTYRGCATMFVGGNVTLDGSFRPAHTNGESVGPYYTPMTATETVGIVTLNNITARNFSINSAKDYPSPAGVVGAFYAGDTFFVTGQNNVRLKGAICAGSFDASAVNSNVHFMSDPMLPQHMPPSMPDSNGISWAATFSPVLGSWARN